MTTCRHGSSAPTAIELFKTPELKAREGREIKIRPGTIVLSQQVSVSDSSPSRSPPPPHTHTHFFNLCSLTWMVAAVVSVNVLYTVSHAGFCPWSFRWIRARELMWLLFDTVLYE